MSLIAGETRWPAKPSLLAFGSFVEKFAGSCRRQSDEPGFPRSDGSGVLATSVRYGVIVFSDFDFRRFQRAGQPHKPTEVYDFSDDSDVSGTGKLSESEDDEEPYEPFG